MHKGVKNNTNFGQITGIQHVNRMPQNRLPRVMKYYSPTGRRYHGRPLKTSGYARPEWVNKWPNSMKDI